MNRLNTMRYALARHSVLINDVFMLVRTMGDDELLKQYVDAYQQCMNEYVAVCAIRNAIRRGYKV